MPVAQKAKASCHTSHAAERGCVLAVPPHRVALTLEKSLLDSIFGNYNWLQWHGCHFRRCMVAPYQKLSCSNKKCDLCCWSCEAHKLGPSCPWRRRFKNQMKSLVGFVVQKKVIFGLTQCVVVTRLRKIKKRATSRAWWLHWRTAK